MKKFVLKTTGAINWSWLEKMVKNGANSLVLFQLMKGEGFAADPLRVVLLNATITIEDPYSVAGIVKINFPKENEIHVETTDYNFDLDPLEIKFKVKSEGFESEYKITGDTKTGTWTGFYTYNGKRIYALEGTLEEQNEE